MDIVRLMYDKDDHKTISSLIEKIGSKERCLQLDFLLEDDNQTLFLTPIGLGYLLNVVAGDIDSLAEAYRAGFKQACKLED